MPRPHGKTPPVRRLRITLRDVAEKAKVSGATVDRVVNERGDVSEEMVRRVIDAARSLGLRRILPSPHRQQLRLEVILTRPDTEYFQRLNAAFAQVAATLDRSVTIHRTFLDEGRPQDFADHIRSKSTNGTIMYCASDHPQIAEAIETAKRAGKPVVTITTDLPSTERLAHVGIDNHRAGRTAGYFVARMATRAGSALILRHSAGYHGHTERVSGFVEALAQHRHDIRIADILNGRDQPALSSQLISRALRLHDDVVAIYCAGAGRRSVGSALERKKAASNVVYIAHELTEQTNRMLRQGVLSLVIDQSPEQQATLAVRILLDFFGHIDGVADCYVPFTLFSIENLP